MPRREADYWSLQEWMNDKEIQRKVDDGVSALTQLYKQGNIHNVNTAKNDIHKLISAAKPNMVSVNGLTKYVNKKPTKMRKPDMRLGRLTTYIETAFDKFKKKKETTYQFVSCLSFTADPKRSVHGSLKRPDLKEDGAS